MLIITNMATERKPEIVSGKFNLMVIGTSGIMNRVSH